MSEVAIISQGSVASHPLNSCCRVCEIHTFCFTRFSVTLLNTRSAVLHGWSHITICALQMSNWVLGNYTNGSDIVVSFKNQGTKYNQAEWQNFTRVRGQQGYEKWMKITIASIYWVFLYAKCCAKPYKYLITFSLSVIPFYSWGGWITERLSDLPKVAQLEAELSSTPLSPDSRASALYPLCSQWQHI